MAATTNQTLWGFLWWMRNNPYKSIESMTEDDLDNLVLAFTTVNESVSSLTLTDPGSYGTLEYPQTGGLSDGNGVTAAQTQLVIDQSHYPDQGYSG